MTESTFSIESGSKTSPPQPSVVREALKTQVPVGENVLLNYDNYTYHIKFYMPNEKQAREYMNERLSLNNVPFDFETVENKLSPIKNNHIVIAETGKTEDIIINSLRIKTVSSTPHRGISTTAEITLEMTELGGSSLVNKIEVASKKMGNESYVKALYCLDLWFSGYNNKDYQKNGVVDNKIPFVQMGNGTEPSNNDGQYLTYVVMATKVDTKNDGLNTKYTFKLVGKNFNLQTTDLLPTNMTEKLDLKKGVNFRTVIQKELKPKFNNLLRDRLNKEAKEVYKDKDIIDFIIDGSKIKDDSSKNAFSGELKGQEVQQGNSSSNNSQQPSTVSANDSNTNPAPTNKTSSGQNGPAIENDNYFNLNSSDNISTIINKIWMVFDPLSGVVPLVDIHQVPLNGSSNSSNESTNGDEDDSSGDGVVGTTGVTGTTSGQKENANNLAYPKYIVTIQMKEIPGLRAYKEGMKKDANPAWTKYITHIQAEYLKGFVEENSIKRRYYNRYCGKSVDVLNYKQSDDQMWFLNISLGEENLITESDKKDENSTESNNSSSTPTNVGIMTVNEVWDEYVTNNGSVSKLKLNMPYDVQPKAGIGFTNIFKTQEETKIHGDGNKQEEAVSSKKQSEKDVKISIARVGAENFFSHGQKLKLELEIIGDPYWLEFGSEFRGSVLSEHFPHVIMVAQSPYKLDKNDEYVQDKSMEFAQLYRILSITSNFVDGKFTQTLNGVVATMFIYVDNINSKNTFEKATQTVQSNQTTKMDMTDVTNSIFKKEMEARLNSGIVGKSIYSLTGSSVEDIVINVGGQSVKAKKIKMGLDYYIDKKTNEIVFIYDGDFGKNSQEMGRYNVNDINIMTDGTILIGKGNEYHYFEKVRKMENSQADVLNKMLGDSMDVLSNDSRVLQDDIYTRVDEENIILYDKDGKKIVAGSLENYDTTINDDGTMTIREKKTDKKWIVNNPERQLHEYTDKVFNGGANMILTTDDQIILKHQESSINANIKDKNNYKVDIVKVNNDSYINLGEQDDGTKKWASVTDMDGNLIKTFDNNKDLKQFVDNNIKGYNIYVHHNKTPTETSTIKYGDVYTGFDVRSTTKIDNKKATHSNVS